MDEPTGHKISLCRLKWDFPSVNLGKQAVRTCCRTPIAGQRVSDADLARHDKQIFLNNPYERERRQEMLQGIRHSDCEHCWKLERSGLESPRVKVEPAELVKFGDGDLLESRRPSMINIELSTLCDAKCIYCNRFFSSRWAAEDLKAGRVDRATLAADQPKRSKEFEKHFWEWFEESREGITHINLIGGEPLISPMYYEVLERLNSMYPELGEGEKPRVTLTTVSNLNTPPKQMKHFLEILPDLTRRYKFSLDASMEATGARAEYIREGVRWKRWLENVNLVLATRPKNFQISFQIAINALCLSTLKEFLVEIRKLRDTYKLPCLLRPNVVTWPKHLSPFILTPDYALYLYEAAQYVRAHHDPSYDSFSGEAERFNWRNYADYLQSMGDSVAKGRPNTEDRAAFFSSISELDSSRKRSFRKIFPEYTEFLELCSTQA